MYLFAYLLMVVSFLCCIAAVVALVARRFSGGLSSSFWNTSLTHGCFWVVTLSLTISSAILVYAFCVCDFRVEYVAAYSSRALPLFYRVTAFWAGQQGSMLFWAWTVALGGVVFIFCRPYKHLTPATRDWFWAFFFTVMAFFFYILLTLSDPFFTLPAHLVPADGNGLNPLLQNPGMIIHPPLLFLGYGGFTIPACLALAQAMSGSAESGFKTGEGHWAEISRPLILVAWLLLTAGIIIGAWWAYMELGWGGYWAWDPVENASLIPWLVATAYLHTAIIEHHRKKLVRANIFLMALVTISAFFATYLVRSGVIKSLHAFGSGGMGLPFVLFVLTALVIAALICFAAPRKSESLEDLISREGLLVIVAWLLLALSGIILVGTMWPVIMQGLISLASLLPSGVHTFVSGIPTGLTQAFYNRVCLPLFALFGLLLLVCPHIKWSGGFNRKGPVLVSVAGSVCFAALLWFTGVQLPLAMVAAAAAIGGIAGIAMLFAANPGLLKAPGAVAAHGVHIGLLLMILGVAFSGPYSVKTENVVLEKGRSAQIGRYTFTLAEVWQGKSAPDASGQSNYTFYEAGVVVTKDDGKQIGSLAPQLRRYHTHPSNLYPEIDTVPGLGNELYASLMGIDEQSGAVNLTIYINPLVNWLWIGGIIMSLLPFWGLRRKRSTRHDEPFPV